VLDAHLPGTRGEDRFAYAGPPGGERIATGASELRDAEERLDGAPAHPSLSWRMVFVERSFEQDVRAEVADLIAYGRLRVVDTQCSPQAFGNASVTMAGGGVRVRLVTDRGDIYGDIAREIQRALEASNARFLEEAKRISARARRRRRDRK
jgi:hypothetical protein